MLRDGDNHGGAVRGPGDETYISFHPGVWLICWQAHGDHIVDGDNRRSARQQWRREIGDVEDIHPGLTRCCRTRNLLPDEFFNIVVARRKARHRTYLIREDRFLMISWRLRPQ